MASILRVLAAVFLLALPAAPAAAAPTASIIEPQLGVLTIAAGSPAKYTILWLRVTATPSVQHHYSLTIDYRDVLSFATVELSLNGTSSVGAGAAPVVPAKMCSRTATSFACEWDETLTTADTLSYIALVSAEPKAAAVLGNQGEIVTSARVDDGTASTTRSIVRVGEGVDVSAGGSPEVEADAGSTASATPIVRNTGSAPVDQVVMIVEADPELLGSSSYSNCRYGRGAMVCAFNTTLAVGGSYAASAPVTLTPPVGSVPGSQAQALVAWMTATEWADLANVLPPDYLTETGTGAPLDLEPAASGRSVTQSDLVPDNDAGTITVTVTGSGQPDLAAIGTRVDKAKGEVKLKVGVANNGPGTLRPELYPNNRVTALVTLPGNVEPVQIDARCRRAAGRNYLCTTTSGLAPGGSELFTFVVRVKNSTGKIGRIEVGDVLPNITSTRATAVAANNVATIVVTGTDGGSGGGGSGGGGLAVTGTEMSDTAVTGFGLVVLGTLLTVRWAQQPVYQLAGVTAHGRRRREPRDGLPGRHRIGDPRGGRRRAGHQRTPGRRRR